MMLHILFFTRLYTNRRYDRSSERIRTNIFHFFFNKNEGLVVTNDFVNYHRLFVSVDSRDSLGDVENDIAEIFYFLLVCMNRRYDIYLVEKLGSIFFFNKLEVL